MFIKRLCKVRFDNPTALISDAPLFCSDSAFRNQVTKAEILNLIV